MPLTAVVLSDMILMWQSLLDLQLASQFGRHDVRPGFLPAHLQSGSERSATNIRIQNLCGRHGDRPRHGDDDGERLQARRSAPRA